MTNPSPSPSDAILIARSQETPEAFAGIFDRHWRRIHAFCAARAGSAGEDIASEVFRTAFRRRADYDPAYPSAHPWLFAIATNLLRDHFRAGRRRDHATARAITAADPIDAAEPLGQLEAHQLGPELSAALGTLPAADRDALLLLAWAELTYDEIAQALGIPVGTVRSRISRARRRLHDHLNRDAR